MPRVPVKLVSWEEIVEWSYGLANKILESGWRPDLVVAVARGGYVPARLICDFLDITDLVSVQSQHWVEAAKMAEKAILRYPYRIDARDLKVLIVDDIIDTGETVILARDFISREWRPKELKVAALQWISSVAKIKPDYYYIEVREWTWFQYPWTRLEDTMQFIERILREDERVKGVKELGVDRLREVFMEWYGVNPDDLGFYWNLAIKRLEDKGVVKREGDRLRILKTAK